MTHQDPAYMIGAVIGALMIGSLCGLLPFLIGRSRDYPALGIVGLLACIVGGFFAGVFLAAPIAVVFTVIILVAGAVQRR